MVTLDSYEPYCDHSATEHTHLADWLQYEKDRASSVLCPVCTETRLEVRVEKKLNHPWLGQGYPAGYTINGREGAPLCLIPGQEYLFDIETPGHPFYLTTDETGGLGAEDAGERIFMQPIVSGKVRVRVPDTDWPDHLFYQCRLHAKMGGRVDVLYDPRVDRRIDANGSEPRVSTRTIADGFESLTAAARWRGSLYVAEQRGLVYRVDESTGSRSVFLDVRRFVERIQLSSNYDERGLLGLAFHPRLDRVYIYYTTREETAGGFLSPMWQDVNCLSEFVIDRQTGKALLKTETFLLVLPQRFSHHNGGTIVFDQKGALLLSVGDDERQGAPLARSQNMGSLYGKVLRLDVDPERRPSRPPLYKIPDDNPFRDGVLGRPEIYCSGLRNPWAMSYTNNLLLVGDTGWITEEELNVGRAGANYGWPYYEGKTMRREPPPGFETDAPIYTYPSGVLTGAQFDAHRTEVVLADFYGGLRWLDMSPRPLSPTVTATGHVESGFFIKALVDHETALVSRHQGPQGATAAVVALIRPEAR